MKELSIAIPKGRLMDSVLEYLSLRGMDIAFAPRQLSTTDSSGRLEVYKVKNHDLPTYVHHGITGLGVVGDDTVAESAYSFTRVFTFPFGQTKLCIAGPLGSKPPHLKGGTVRVATSYVRMCRNWFHHNGIPVKIIRLNGSVELAPSLGLADYICDLVETGSTLEANGLEVIKTINDIRIRLIANSAYFKLHYRDIQKLTDILNEG